MFPVLPFFCVSILIEEHGQVNDEDETSLPEFVGQVPNITVQIGRDARLPCIIRNLASYQVVFQLFSFPFCLTQNPFCCSLRGLEMRRETFLRYSVKW